jgi:hypothetical protein
MLFEKYIQWFGELLLGRNPEPLTEDDKEEICGYGVAANMSVFQTEEREFDSLYPH